MAVVDLPSPLRELAGGSRRVDVDGQTVGEIVSQLERTHPKLIGWVVDETGRLRQHVRVFVNGESVGLDAAVGADDMVRVLPSISGGAPETATMTAPVREVDARQDETVELLVGTRKGLFVFRGPRGERMDNVGRAFAGDPVEFAMRDDRTGTYYASVTYHYGPKLLWSEDPLVGWEPAEGVAFPEDSDTAVERIWVIRKGVEDGVLWAGVAPAALFRSEDAGRTWQLNQGLWNEPSRVKWQPGAGGMCLHSICTWPGDPSRLAVAISAAGVWLSDDGGDSWRRGVKGLVPRYIPEEARAEALDLCVHNIHRNPIQPETVYMQFHGGVYRSDDAGESWNDIGSGGGLPSDFGFPLVQDPNDPDRAYVIPLVGAEDRVPPEGKLRVYETKDRGETWWPLTEGLPQEGAYQTILRQAFCHDRRRPLGLYFGTESGEVYGSADGGESWQLAAEHLAPVLSVRCAS